MRKDKKPSVAKISSFKVGRSNPEDIQRQETTKNQTRFDEGTLIWGSDDAFPLRLAKAVQESPAATSCIDVISRFTKGASFSDKELMNVKVNKMGTTLWDLHSELCGVLSLYDGFSLNFKYNEMGKITNVYVIPFESIRFVKPDDDLQTEINFVKYNPYFGTAEYKKEYSKEYPLYNQKLLNDQISEYGTKFPGQVYYFGRTKPTYRFYPHPDYWSANKWIYVDAKIQEAHATNLDNGFFQSCMITIVGDPNRWSENPEYQETYLDSNGVERKRATKTVGQEFNEQMSQTFSGSDKMGNVFVRWVLNKDDAVDVAAFPNNTNADLFLALQDLTTKNITIATKVPGILANISEGVNLGSTGNEIQKAIELTQAITADNRNVLMNLYNEVILPNLDESLNGREILEAVEIVNYNPVTVPIEIDDKFWEVLTMEEKREFIKNNISSIQLIDPKPILNQDGTVQEDPVINEAFRNMTGRQLENIQRIIRKFNRDELTYDQAKAMLKSGFALTDEQADTFLITPQEDETANSLTVSK